MTPIKDVPAYSKLTAELNSLGVALGRINARMAEIDIALQTPKDFDHGAAHLRAAMRFSETGVVEVDTAPADLQAEQAVLRNQSAALLRALQAKRDALESLRSQLSGDICKAAGAAHRKLAARALALLEELDQLAEDEVKLVNGIESAGYNANFKTLIEWPYLGRLSQRSESASWYRVRELRTYIG